MTIGERKRLWEITRKRVRGNRVHAGSLLLPRNRSPIVIVLELVLGFSSVEAEISKIKVVLPGPSKIKVILPGPSTDSQRSHRCPRSYSYWSRTHSPVVRSLQHWVKTLSQSEVEQVELSGEGQRGVIRLEDLIGGKQQVRLQEHSIRALRCTIAPTLLGGSFRDFVARLALLYKTYRKHLRNGFHKQAHAVLTFTQPLFSTLAFDAFYRYLRPNRFGPTFGVVAFMNATVTQTAIVTGASSGIGLGITKALLERGWHDAVLYLQRRCGLRL